MITEITAAGGVLVSLIVGVLAYLPSRRHRPARASNVDLEARDRLIDQLQERVDQQAAQLAYCENSHAHTRQVLDNTLDQLDELRRLYQSALLQLDLLTNQITALSATHGGRNDGGTS